MHLSTDRIVQAAVAAAAEGLPPAKPAQGPRRHLDIGAGDGSLIAALRRAMPLDSTAVDYTSELMRLEDVEVRIVDLNDAALPFTDACFDLVTCTEVIEHLENYRKVCREAARVLRPGGLAVFTTPNVLNLKSRWRYLTFGFPNLFGPLPLHPGERWSTNGHITLIPHFYLAQALADSGFERIRLSIDRRQRSSAALLCVLWPFIAICGGLTLRQERRHWHTIDAGNEAYVRRNFSTDLMLGRTIVVSARRAAV